MLRGLEQIQHIPLDMGSLVVHASSADPYVALLTEDGQVILLTLRESRGLGRLSVFKPTIPTVIIELIFSNYVFLCSAMAVCNLLILTFRIRELQKFAHIVMSADYLHSQRMKNYRTPLSNRIPKI